MITSAKIDRDNSWKAFPGSFFHKFTCTWFKETPSRGVRFTITQQKLELISFRLIKAYFFIEYQVCTGWFVFVFYFLKQTRAYKRGQGTVPADEVPGSQGSVLSLHALLGVPQPTLTDPGLLPYPLPRPHPSTPLFSGKETSSFYGTLWSSQSKKPPLCYDLSDPKHL